MALYQVQRLVVEYTTIEAQSETEALNLAEICGDYDREPLQEDDEVFYGFKVFELKD